jgi:hypothetical protein
MPIDFFKNTRGLTRNPLGIIALFVSMIYGFSCLVLSASITNLKDACERLPLIWFVIIFPIIILIAFVHLVKFHHEKLYSPGDFRDDESFIQTSDENKRNSRIQDEVSNLETSPKSEESGELVSSKEITSAKKTVDFNLIKDPSSFYQNSSELLKIYTNSEKWALNELNLKYKVILKPQVRLNTALENFEFDGYGSNRSSTFIVEVKFWQYSRSDKKLKLKIQEFLSKKPRIDIVFRRQFKKTTIIIAIVFDDLTRINKEKYVEFVNEIGGENVILEFFDYRELKRNYE